MKKIIGTLALTAMMITPTFANVEGTVQGDIMLTSLETSETPVYDGTSTTTQGDVMPINTVLDGTTDVVQDDIMLTSETPKTIKFYRDGKTPKTYKSLEDLLKNEKNVTTVTDGCNNGFVMGTGAAMTMMYCENTYGSGQTANWQRTDTLISIYGDNANYFNEKLFKKLDSKTKLKQNASLFLSKISIDSLNKAQDSIFDLIDATKLSRIAKQAQDQKITKLYFVKTLIDDAIAARK
ncbi:hypothetical protein H3C61_00645 [Candidatus Gracilibacteria bacterium]|nr:hypothetical protein [Candidatus Gracilibacteria bacterium]